MFSAALIAAGVGLVPSAAQADPVTSDGRSVAVPDVDADFDKAKDAAKKTFSSPADRTVRKTLPAAKGLAAAQSADAVDQDLKVELDGFSNSALGAWLSVAVQSADVPLTVTIAWGDGTEDVVQTTGSLAENYHHVYKKSGAYTAKVTVKDAVNKVEASNQIAVTLMGSDFTPHAPTRLLDTRSGTGAAKTKVAARSSVRVKIAQNAQIPQGVTAVALNVTVTNTTEAGHVTVFPGKGSERPDTSNVNYTAGQSVPNLVIVPVGEDGYVELFNGGWQPIDLIADVTGYFTQSAASGYTSLAPTRFVDSRSGLGTAKGQVPGYGTFSTQINGLGGVPQTATAVALNVTVTNPREAGHLTAFPSGGAVPSTSNLNFTAGQTVANSVIVPVGPDGKISVRNGSWLGADVIVDVVGYYSPESKAAFVPFEPGRIFDSRDPEYGPVGPAPARAYLRMQISDGEGVEGYVLNTTVTNPTDTGFLSVSPDPNAWEDYENGTAEEPQRPVSSTLNWTPGQTVPNLVQASAGEHGVVDFWNQSFGTADLIVDMFGYYGSN
ncbi:PKD domain-containing protein [Streptomyces sp. 4.24]|uniref:PKD domain-containing protein n=1 Tax=Streptomyces tritrimontium TaxID=3406573 RepID=UPI003BB74BE3